MVTREIDANRNGTRCSIDVTAVKNRSGDADVHKGATETIIPPPSPMHPG
jgi:hypothetical protein